MAHVESLWENCVQETQKLGVQGLFRKYTKKEDEK